MIDISAMSTKEKLQTMELLWDDLCHDQAVSVPDWHLDVLEQRDKEIKNGKASYTSWDKAKASIEGRIKN